MVNSNIEPVQPRANHRQSMRLKGYDYARAGAYFVTICVLTRECVFGEVVDGKMAANLFGKIVANAWSDLPKHYPQVEVDRFAVMPNHVHGILLVGAGFKPALTEPARNPTAPIKGKRHGLPEIVRAFKTFSARHINESRNSPGRPVWQRNYYEHIIRDDADYERIAEYVDENPQRWIDDKLHPDNFCP